VIAAAGVEVLPPAVEDAAGVGPLEKKPQPAVSMAAPASMPMNLMVVVEDRVMVGEL
jgi:hypothetical protein